MILSHQTTETSKPLRCLVIQLARLGDTLQSLMALRAAKQLYPQLEIHLLVRERFSGAAKRVSWINEVITLPTETLLGPLLVGEKTETETLGDVARWIAPLVKEPWDMIVNWSFSDPSSYLTGILPAKIKLGYTRRKDATFCGADGWSHYVQAIVQGRVCQNIHLTDILTTQLLTALQIHAGDPQTAGNEAVTSKGFFTLTHQAFELPKNRAKKWLAIQLGAGQDCKTWAPEKWAGFIKHVVEKSPDYGIFLLGGKEDQKRAEKIFSELSPEVRESPSFISLVGETDFDLWASVISKCQWVLAGDTAALHLASVLGTRVLNVSVGPVRYRETGPYGNGHYIVASDGECEACKKESQTNHSCASDITPEGVYGAWSYASNEWAHRRQISLESHFSTLSFESHVYNIQVYRSKIRNTADGGGVVYEPIIKRPLKIDDWSAMVVGQIARSWYCGWIPPVGQEILRECISSQFVRKLQELRESTDVLTKICDQASKTASTLNRKSLTLKSEKLMNIEEKMELQDLGKALSDLEILIERLAHTHAPLLAFSQMSKVLLHHLKGDQLSDLGKETSECYKQLNEGVAIFREWIKYTLDLAKPRTIKSATITALPRPVGTDLAT